MAGTDRFRQQCERLLEPGESILLEANAALMLGMLRQQGVGRAFLTNRRLVWLHMAPRLLLFFCPWLHRTVEIRIDRVRSIVAEKVLSVSTNDERYLFRLAERYWALFNPFAASEQARACEDWGRKLRELVAGEDS